ncbi:MAG: glycerol-3-phosphate 1-O-acyltransferase PlsY [Planctomycetes bacterium]|nr:glycerol-3-phosphate 1-O-acyltransferase PlsY [Planctomycetota bacterium]
MTDDPLILYCAAPVAAYIIGSTPFGVIIGKFKGVDLRKAGSGNVGATNVARVLGRSWGYLCFLLDLAKGLAPALAVCLLVRPAAGQTVPSVAQQCVWLGVGMGCILGHVLTFWLKFRGGKGVATALGVVLGIFPYFTWAGLSALAIWIIFTLASRYVSVGSIVAALAFLPLVMAFNHSAIAALWPLEAFAAAMVLLILIRHRSNIARLFRGQENKIGGQKNEQQSAKT